MAKYELTFKASVAKDLRSIPDNSIVRSKMISRRREGGDAGVLFWYVEENPTKPTKRGL